MGLLLLVAEGVHLHFLFFHINTINCLLNFKFHPMKQKYTTLKFALICVLMGLYFNSLGQITPFSFGGGQQVDECLGIAMDNQGNTFATGYFSQVAQIGNTSFNSSGSLDIWVAKFSGTGQVLWAKKAGGNAADKGLSIAVDNTGNCFVTGFFTGTATFGTQTITSSNGTQDIFLAKYDSNGNLLWVKRAGGAMTGDIGYAVTTDPQGNAIITGQFRGTATFGLFSLTSIIDPTDGLPSYDVFIAKYDANGNEMWAKSGSAKFTDRGLGIACDAIGNIYVTGQFSDTIQFSTTHHNTIQNAAFLLKLAPNGDEIWFRKIGGGQMNISYGIYIDNNNKIYLTGDSRGNNLIFFSPAGNQTLSNSTYPHKIFAAVYDTSGAFLRARMEASASDVSSRAIVSDANGNIYISGHFKCVFSGLADSLGSGLFNSVGFWDIFTIKYDSLLNGLWSQQAGSRKEDYCWANAIGLAGNLIIGGSFKDTLFTPSDMNLNIPGATTFTVLQQAPTYCNHSPYNQYLSIYSKGNSDLLVGSIFNENRLPYDYYIRDGISCQRDYLRACASFNCPDTVVICEEGFLNSATHTNSVGPHFKYLWSNGDTTYQIKVNISGDYTIRISSEDGCFISLDTIYADVRPLPPVPLISDNLGINNQALVADTIFLCHPDSALIYTNSSPNTGYWEFTPNSQIVNSDTTINLGSGLHLINIIGQNGCTNYNEIYVQVDHLPALGLKMNLNGDTIEVCETYPFLALVYDTIANPPGDTICLTGGIMHWQINSGSVTPNCPSGYLGIVKPTTTGWHYLQATFIRNNTCGADTTIVIDSAYVIVNPLPNIQPYAIFGDTILCPGDTIPIWTNAVGSLIWQPYPSGIAGPNNTDTISVFNHAEYELKVTLTNNFGCTRTTSKFHKVKYKPQPQITASPFHGVICPGDSVLLTVDITGTYIWYGPMGLMANTTQSAYVSQVGYYYCIVTDTSNCQRASNTFEVRGYATPFAELLSPEVICQGDSAQIAVHSSTFGTYVWQSPLSGSDTIVWVSQPGTYTCQITSCGIVTMAGVTVTMSTVSASITASANPPVCTGDTILLSGNQGMFQYEWLPGGEFSQNLHVSSPGTYSLVTFDQYGCSDTAQAFTYYNHPAVAPPLVNGTIICSGAQATLQASSPLPVYWYNTQGGTQLAIGSSFTTGSLLSDTVFYARSYDGTCYSLGEEINVLINPASLEPVITYNQPVCNGGTMQFSTPFIPNAIYTWSGPVNFQSSVQNPQITPVDSTHAGTYYLIVSEGGCTSPTGEILVNINAPVTLTLSSNGPVCENANLQLLANAINNASYQWVGPNGFQSSAISPPLNGAGQWGSGYYYLTVTAGTCLPVTDSVWVQLIPNPAPPALSYDSLCENDNLNLFASFVPGATYNWSGPLSFSSTLQNPNITNAGLAHSETYSATVTVNGCTSSPASISVAITPRPTITGLPSSVDFCEGATVQISAGPSQPSVITWLGPNAFTAQGNSISIPNALPNHSGIYQVYALINTCHGDTQQVQVDIISPPLLDSVQVVSACDGGSIVLSTGYHAGMNYSWIGPNNFSGTGNPLTIVNAGAANDGVYFVTGNLSGCQGNTVSGNVQVQPIPSTPSASSNSPVCAFNNIILQANSPLPGNYLWVTPAGNFIGPTLNITAHNTSFSGSYSLIQEANGCQSLPFVVNVQVLPAPVAPNLNISLPVCEGDTLTISGNSSSTTNYIWQGPANFNISQLEVTIPGASAIHTGTYTLTSSIGNCQRIDSVLIQVHQPPYFSLGMDTILCTGQSLELTTGLSNAAVIWQGQTSTANYTVQSSGIYWALATSAAGCTFADTISVQFENCELNIPNVFSPNSDGKNDLYQISDEGFKKYSLIIFNRWGEKVVELTETNKTWNGKLSNGTDAPEGTYFYNFEGFTLLEKINKASGFITLLR
jgi:gliding motility-associated-like protein